MFNRTVAKAFFTMLLVLLFSTTAHAKPEINLEQMQEKEITVEKDGKLVKKRIKAEDIAPGEKIYYTITFNNSGDEAARNVKIKNAFPAGVTYVAGSASTTPWKPTFSIDGGQTFNEPGRLTYEKQDEKSNKEILPAKPSSYTHIQWIATEVKPGDSGELTFQVSVD